MIVLTDLLFGNASRSSYLQNVDALFDHQCCSNVQFQMEKPPRPDLIDFHDVSMIHYFTDNWENIQSFQARPDDILIVTYPKAGL